MNIKVTARRLRVFRFVKEHMELHGECPTAGMVAEALGLSRQTARNHMTALRGAEGLPLSLNTLDEGRRVCVVHGRYSNGGRASAHLVATRRGFEPIAAPVDLVMRERRAIPAWAAGDE